MRLFEVVGFARSGERKFSVILGKKSCHRSAEQSKNKARNYEIASKGDCFVFSTL